MPRGLVVGEREGNDIQDTKSFPVQHPLKKRKCTLEDIGGTEGQK